MINPPSTSLESAAVDSRVASSAPRGRASGDARTFSDVLGELHAASSHESSSSASPPSVSRQGAPRTHHEPPRAPRRQIHHDSATALRVEEATLAVPGGPPPAATPTPRGPVDVAHVAGSTSPSPSLVEPAAMNFFDASSAAVRPGEGDGVVNPRETTGVSRGPLGESPIGALVSRVTLATRAEGNAMAKGRTDVTSPPVGASVTRVGHDATTQLVSPVRPSPVVNDEVTVVPRVAGVTPPTSKLTPTLPTALTSPTSRGPVTAPAMPRRSLSRRSPLADVTSVRGDSSVTPSWVTTPAGDVRGPLGVRDVTPSPTPSPTSTPTGTFAGPTSFDASRFVSDVTRTLVGEGDYRVALALHPDQLGTVRATISLSGNELTVAITPDSRQGHEALTHELDGLRGELSRGGLNVNVTLHDHSGTRHQDETPDIARRILNDDAVTTSDAITVAAVRPTSDGQIHVVL